MKNELENLPSGGQAFDTVIQTLLGTHTHIPYQSVWVQVLAALLISASS